MVLLNRVDVGVPLAELRAAVVLSRVAAADGVEWSWPQWETLWGALTAPQQRVVYLVVLLGLSQREVADELDVSRAAVAQTWRRALARIRDTVPADN